MDHPRNPLNSVVAAFLLHVIVEIPAMAGFLLSPSKTLQQNQPFAAPLIRQYGILLLCTNLLLCFILLELFHNDGFALSMRFLRRVSGAVALYHPAPLWRAVNRIRRGELSRGVFASPWSHALLHAGCLVALLLPVFQVYPS